MWKGERVYSHSRLGLALQGSPCSKYHLWYNVEEMIAAEESRGGLQS